MPKELDSIDVLRQLRCAGMLESIRIRRAGYSVRRHFKEFFNHFRLLAPQLNARADSDYKELCRKLLTYLDEKLHRDGIEFEKLSWQLGRSKVFLREDVQHQYEKRLAQCSSAYCVRITKHWRGFVVRRAYKEQRAAACTVQALLRMARQVKAYQRMLKEHNGAVAVQKCVRGLPHRRRFWKQKLAAVCVQRRFRGWATRQRIGKVKGKMAQDRVRKLQEEQRLREAAEEQTRVLEKMQAEKALLEETIGAQRQEAANAAREEERQRILRERDALESAKSAAEERHLRDTQKAEECMRAEKERMEQERDEWRRKMEREEQEREERRRRMMEEEERDREEREERRRKQREEEDRERERRHERMLQEERALLEIPVAATASSSSTAVATACATETADRLQPVFEQMSVQMGTMAQELAQLRAENSDIEKLRFQLQEAEREVRDTKELMKDMDAHMRTLTKAAKDKAAEHARARAEQANDTGADALRMTRLEAEVCKKALRIDELETENAQLKKERAIWTKQLEKNGVGDTALARSLMPSLDMLGGPVERLDTTMIPGFSKQ